MCHPDEGEILKGDFLRTSLLSRSIARSLLRRDDIIRLMQKFTFDRLSNHVRRQDNLKQAE